MNVILTEPALDMLEAASEFMLHRLEIPLSKVIEIQEELLDAAMSLADNPERGPMEPLLSHRKHNYRRLIVGHFKVLYFVQSPHVYVTHFFDSRQDPEKM